MSYNVNSDLILGNDLVLYVSGTPIAYAKTADLSVSCSEIDCTNKMSGKFKTVLPGQISWSISSDFMFTKKSDLMGYDKLLDVLTNHGVIDCTIGTYTDSATFAMSKGYYQGKCIITSLSLKGEDNAIATCSVALNGTGALTKVAA